MSMFETLAGVLDTAEHVTLKVSKEPKGKLTVVVVPVLKPSNGAESDELLEIRAGLAMPLKLTGTPMELDNEFFETVRLWRSHRDSLSESDQFLRAVKESAKQGAAAQRAAADKAPATPKTETPNPQHVPAVKARETQAVPPPSLAENPADLFG